MHLKSKFQQNGYDREDSIIHSKTPIPTVTTLHCDYMVTRPTRTSAAVTTLYSDYVVTITVIM